MFLSAFRSRVAQIVTGALRVGAGSQGTKIKGMFIGRVSIGSGASSGSVTLTGVTSSSRVFATITSGNSSSRHVVTAIASTNSVAVTLSGTAGSATTVDVFAVNLA